MSRKVLSGVIAVLLACAPMGLSAQEREARSAGQAAGLEWLAGLWDDVAAWFGSDVDGRCAIDPDGCPDGAAPPAQPLPEASVDGRCSLDPNGCPGGG
jgi:hypothetical protein